MALVEHSDRRSLQATHLIIQLQIVYMDVSRANLRLDLVRIELTRLQEVPERLLEYERDEPLLDTACREGEVEGRDLGQPGSDP